MFGRNELLPGAGVAVSVMLPIPTEWWFRPVSKAWRVGAHNAVVGKRLKAQPTEHGGWRVAGDVGCTMKTMRSPVVTPGR